MRASESTSGHGPCLATSARENLRSRPAGRAWMAGPSTTRASCTTWSARSLPTHTHRLWRHQTFSDEAIQFCLSIKCLFNLPLRQAMGMAQSLLRLAGLHWPVPDYSTVSRRQKTLQVAIGATPTTTGLHLLVDSTGIKMLGEGE